MHFLEFHHQEQNELFWEYFYHVKVVLGNGSGMVMACTGVCLCVCDGGSGELQ